MSDISQNKINTLTITRAILSPVLNTGIEKIDIIGLIYSFSISESIITNTISVSVSIIDNVGLLESYPLRGEERVIITVRDFMGNTVDYDLFLYKIDSIVPNNKGDGLSYTLHLFSYQHFLASSKRIIRSFKDNKVVTLIDKLFQEFYGGIKQLNIEQEVISSDDLTENLIRGTIPNLTVPQAIEFLVRRSYSTQRKSSSFRFFENSESYFFISDEGLEEYAIRNGKVFNLTNSRIPEDPGFFELQKNNLETVTNSKRFNTMDDMFGGYYKNEVLEIDILNKKIDLLSEQNVYDYQQRGNSYFGDNKFRKIVDRHTKEFSDTFFTRENSKKFIIIKDYMDIGAFDNSSLPGNRFFPTMISNRHAFRSHLNSTIVDAIGPPRLDICAGNIINLDILEFNSKQDKKESNKQLSGKYIVKSVLRVSEGDTSKNRYTLIKRDWNNTKSKLGEQIDSRLKTALN
jgi:hypothetical protein